MVLWPSKYTQAAFLISITLDEKEWFLKNIKPWRIFMLFFWLFILFLKTKITNITQLFHAFWCKRDKIIYHFKSYVIEWAQYYYMYSLLRGFYFGQPPSSYAYHMLYLKHFMFDLKGVQLMYLQIFLYGKEAWIARLKSG